MIAELAAAAVILSGSSTAYASCDGSTTQTASGKTVRVGYVANNALPLGTWIQMVKPRRVMNRRFFVVMDSGGSGFVLDFWSPSCSWMNNWGRRSVSFRVLGRRDLYRGRPTAGWSFKPTNSGARLRWSAR